MEKIILASSSPRRRELLSQAGFRFEVVVSEADERIETETPKEMVEELSERKAEAVAALFKAQAQEETLLIIGADTMVAIDGKKLGKPAGEKGAEEMLKELSGRTHQVYTGVTLLRLEKGENGTFLEKRKTFSEKTEVTFYPMTETEIREYIATGEPMDKAGAYGIQGKAAVFVKEIRGDYNNVVGLPIARLYQEIRKGESD